MQTAFFITLSLFIAMAVGQVVYYPDYYGQAIDNEPYGPYSTFNYAYYRQYVTNVFDDDDGINPDDDDDGADDDDLVGGLDDDYFFDDDDLVRIDDDEIMDYADDDFGNEIYFYYTSSSSLLKPCLFVIGASLLALY